MKEILEMIYTIDEKENKYEGDFHEGKKHGYGVMVLVNGVKLEGNWNEDNLDGDVKKIYPNGEVKKLFYQNGIKLG